MQSGPSTYECQCRSHAAERRRSQRCAHSHGTRELVNVVPIHAVDGAELASDRPCAQRDRQQLRCKQQHVGIMQAAMREVVKVAMFEAPVTHPVDEVMRFFAMAAAYGSRTPRPCWRCMCYCILVAGTACNALSSELA